MKYGLACDSWDENEYKAIQKVINSGMFSMGKKVLELESKFAAYFGAKYCVMSNSGSSANLLAIAALVYSNKLKKGDEVIVTSVSWSTTYHPLQQYGLKVKFVDIDRETLNISVDSLKHAISDDTKLILLVNLLGNNNDFDSIYKLAEKSNVLIMEDNCESMGSTYKGKYSGSFGVLGTFSSFYSHHIATMEGGYTITNDKELYDIMKAVRAHGWTRNLDDESSIYTKKENKFYEQFNFILPGYNLRPLEIEAALAIEQIDKLDDIVKIRQANAKKMKEQMKKFSNKILLQKEVGKSSWFGFSLVLINDLEGKRDKFVRHLLENNIEVRPIVAGNFTKNTCIKYYDYEISGELTNADYIHDNGCFIGNNGKDLTLEIDWFIEVLERFFKKNEYKF